MITTVYNAEQRRSVYSKKLNVIRSIQSVKLNKEYTEPSLVTSQKLFAATNSYIQQCVSVLLEVPIGVIRHTKKVQAASNARMVCWYILKKRTGMSIRQVGALYDANESMVHRKLAQMESYVENRVFPEYLMCIDLVNTALDEKIMLNYYEKSSEQAS